MGIYLSNLGLHAAFSGSCYISNACFQTMVFQTHSSCVKRVHECVFDFLAEPFSNLWQVDYDLSHRVPAADVTELANMGLGSDKGATCVL